MKIPQYHLTALNAFKLSLKFNIEVWNYEIPLADLNYHCTVCLPIRLHGAAVTTKHVFALVEMNDCSRAYNERIANVNDTEKTGWN